MCPKLVAIEILKEVGNSASHPFTSFVISAMNYCSEAVGSLRWPFRCTPSSSNRRHIALQVIDDILLKKHLWSEVTPTLVTALHRQFCIWPLLWALLYGTVVVLGSLYAGQRTVTNVMRICSPTQLLLFEQ